MSLYWGSVYWKSTCWPFWNSLVLTSLCHAVNSHVILSKFMPWPLPSQSHRLWRDKELVSQFSRSVMSDSLRPHGLQHFRLPCSSPFPGACWNSCPLTHWCHPTISSSVFPFSSCLLSFSESGSFPTSQLFTSGDQSIGTSASASILPLNIQDWFSLGLTGLISLQSKVCSRVFSNTTVQKHQFFSTQPSSWSNSHIHTWLLKKTLALTIWTFVSKVMSLLFIMWSLS